MKKFKLAFNMVGIIIFNLMAVNGFLDIVEVKSNLTYYLFSFAVGVLTVISYRDEIKNEFGKNQNKRCKL